MTSNSDKADPALAAVQEVIYSQTEQAWPEGVPAQEILWDMKRNGLAKPSNVPDYLWSNLKKISYNHENVADLMLLGYTKKEIAEKLGCTASGISLETRTPTFKAYYALRRKERQQVLSRDGITELLDAAIDTAGEIMQNEKAKDATRLDAAKYIIDQSLGKAKQEVKVESTNLLAATIAKVDELRSRPVSEQPDFLVKPRDKYDDFIDSLDSTETNPAKQAEEKANDGEEHQSEQES